MTKVKGVICGVCNKAPAKVNTQWKECSAVECPHRRRCWSERTAPAEYKGPWTPSVDADPVPLDQYVKELK